ncbi:hypothetical protein LGR54_00380 [Ancylobacter sp. Lp-2]|uniref:hypothetical protein n=1 Tax=Ancylobacter sp. Lp-2 TaxID=2881339 RepID=UPI001E356A88|nr:hypothetical protein [Ancylobacter sp. Lp-2]MCB4767052.1 hypothetical protein [Ancylobacter sp. Lp-2]
MLTFEALKSMDNLILVEQDEWFKLIDKFESISRSSPFALVYILSKIPFLKRFGLLLDIVEFLDSIRHYTGRGLAYVIGNTSSSVPDIEKNISICGVEYYRSLMCAVANNRESLGPACSHIMISAAVLSARVAALDIGQEVQKLARIQTRFGLRVTTTLLEYLSINVLKENLDDVFNKLTDVASFGEDYLCFYIMNGIKSDLDINHAASFTRPAVIDALRNYDANRLSSSPQLFSNADVAALLHNWRDLSYHSQMLIISQLESSVEAMQGKAASSSRYDAEMFGGAFGPGWCGPWAFCGRRTDITFARDELTSIMGGMLDRSSRIRLVRSHPSLFDRSLIFTDDRISSICDILFEKTSDKHFYQRISALKNLVNGDDADMRRCRSANKLWFCLWRRDPWSDYGRSDRMYSCTGFGDYAADSAPLAMQDRTLNKIEIWDNNELTCRLNICLVTDQHRNVRLLVDSLEGSDKSIKNSKKFVDVFSAISDLASFSNIGGVLINVLASYNNTPRRFSELVRQRANGQLRFFHLRRLVPVAISAPQLLSIPMRPYLETFKLHDEALVEAVSLDELRY